MAYFKYYLTVSLLLLVWSHEFAEENNYFIEFSDVVYDYTMHEHSDSSYSTIGTLKFRVTTNCAGIIKAEKITPTSRLPLLINIAVTKCDTSFVVQLQTKARNLDKYVIVLTSNEEYDSSSSPKRIVSDTLYVDNYISEADLSKLYSHIDDMEISDIDFSIENNRILINNESEIKNLQLFFYSIKGLLIKSISIESKNTYFDVFPSGYYIIKLTSLKKSVIKKVLL